MNILGIESSCDETAAAVVKDGCEILSNVVTSSEEIHKNTGGIIPENAARKQIESITPVVQQALKKANSEPTNHQSPITSIDAIAVTAGPGLIGSLLVGVEFAKTLSFLWKKPIIPVNHLVGHIYANWLVANEPPQFPVLALVVSGGHTDLVLMRGHGKINWIGGTRDDAAGEAFDKTARLLGLPYPGGPSIAAQAENYKLKINNYKLNLFPRPLIDSNDYDFSFSGLKTSVANHVRKLKTRKPQFATKELAANIQEAIIDVLVAKTLKAADKHKTKSLLLAGGVAANSRLRKKFLSEIKAKKLSVNFHVPPPKLCTDNAAYVAATAYYNYHPIKWNKVDTNPQLTIAD